MVLFLVDIVVAQIGAAEDRWLLPMELEEDQLLHQCYEAGCGLRNLFIPDLTID
jgi:hypothetical protein